MSMIRTRWIILGFASAVIFCLHASADDAKPLLSATSPFEDMIGPALSSDDAELAKCLMAADGQSASVKKALPADAVARFDELLKSIHQSVAAKDHYATADGAVNTFKLLVDHVKPDGLKVPKEVSLMDYAGFKLQVLAAARQADWDAMRKTAADAASSWNAIKSQVSDKRVRDTVNSAIAGMGQAAKFENLAMIQFAAQIDLDLVDVLEGHFESKR